MPLKTFGFLPLTAMMAVGAGADSSAPSVYTPLSGAQCRIVKQDKETGASVSQCPGVGGYSLLVAEDDSRMSVTVVEPGLKERPLDYWGVVTRSLSTLGPRAEWRVSRLNGKTEPTALIVRVQFTDRQNPERPVRKSLLAVAKISAAETCVVARIPAAADANAQARQAASVAGTQPCLPQLE